jgi:flagellar biosynthetic protein FliP
MKKNKKRFLFYVLLLIVLISLTSCDTIPELSAPGVTFSVSPADQPEQVTTGVQLLVLLTVLSLAPSILILGTSFTRIVIVVSMVRNAIGTNAIPPNQVVIGLSLLLTFFVMQPVYTEVNRNAIQPYLNKQIDQKTALNNAIEPVREFMFKQTREKDIQLFLEIRGESQPETLVTTPTLLYFQLYVISELRNSSYDGFSALCSLSDH